MEELLFQISFDIIKCIQYLEELRRQKLLVHTKSKVEK